MAVEIALTDVGYREVLLVGWQHEVRLSPGAPSWYRAKVPMLPLSKTIRRGNGRSTNEIHLVNFIQKLNPLEVVLGLV